MNGSTLHPMVKFISEHIKNPPEMSDKTRIMEYMHILENPESQTAYKCFALNGLSYIIIKHGPGILDVYGAIPVIIDQLKSNNPLIEFEAIRTIHYLTKHGADIYDEIKYPLKDVLTRKSTPEHLREFGKDLILSG
jgi:hypothetical protein